MKRRTPADWKNIIQDQQASGLTAVEFCRQQHIDSTYFSSQKQKLKRQSSPFVTATLRQSSTAAITISWKNIRLELGQQPEPAYVAALVKALDI